MALLFTLPPSLFSFSSSKNSKPLLLSSSKIPSSLSFSRKNPTKTFTLRPLISRSSYQPDPTPEPDSEPPTETTVSITDEWGEKTEPESEPELTKLPDSDPPKNEDEWGEYVSQGNGSAGPVVEEDDDNNKLRDLKRSLVDTVYGTEFGFRAGAEVRAEVLELVNQLEALNPTPTPVEAAGVLDGNWVLVWVSLYHYLIVYVLSWIYVI